jgi:hypothetical protein
VVGCGPVAAIRPTCSVVDMIAPAGIAAVINHWRRAYAAALLDGEYRNILSPDKGGRGSDQQRQRSRRGRTIAARARDGRSILPTRASEKGVLDLELEAGREMLVRSLRRLSARPG